MNTYSLKKYLLFTGSILLVALFIVTFSGTSVKASGGVTFGASSTTADTGSAQTSATWTHTTGNGSNTFMMVTVSECAQPASGADASVTALTYNGVSLSNLDTLSGGNSIGQNCHEKIEVWYLVAPAAGSHTMSITFNKASFYAIGVATYSGVDPITPLGTQTKSSGTTSGTQAVTLAVNSNTTQLVYNGIATNNVLSAPTGTQRTLNSLVVFEGSQDTTGGSSSTTLGWTVNSGDWEMISVPLNPLVPTPTPTNTPTLTPIPTLTPTASSSTNSSSGSSPPNPNAIAGWSKTIMAGPHFIGTSSFLSGGSGKSTAQTFINTDAIHDDVFVTITKIQPSDLVLPLTMIPFPWSQGLNIGGDIFYFSVVSAFNGYPIPKFDKSVTVILPYDPVKLYGINPNNLFIAMYEQSSKKWILLPNSIVNIQNHTLATTVKQFSYFVVVYRRSF